MRTIAHHLYTSIEGQRTVFVSPSIEPLRGELDARAQAGYVKGAGFDLIHFGGHWLCTFVMENGVDHVHRERFLVHQVMVSSNQVPVMFSPLFLREVCLTRLEQADSSLGDRLIHDLGSLDLRSVMPAPDSFGKILSGASHPVLATLMDGLLVPGFCDRAVFPGSEKGRKELAAALCVPLLHRPDVRISTYEKPLSVPTWADDLVPTLILEQPGRSTGKSHRIETSLAGGVEDTMSMQPIRLRGAWILNLLASARDVPALMFALRQIPLASLLDPPDREALAILLPRIFDRLHASGVPDLDPANKEDLQVLRQLRDNGGEGLVRLWAESVGPRLLESGCPAFEPPFDDSQFDRCEHHFDRGETSLPSAEKAEDRGNPGQETF